MKNSNTVSKWVEVNGIKACRVDFKDVELVNKSTKVKVSRRVKLFTCLLVIMALLAGAISSLIVFADVDVTPYENTKLYVDWDMNLFLEIDNIKSDLVMDYLEFKSFSNWDTISSEDKKTYKKLYGSAKKLKSRYNEIIKVKEVDGELYRIGLSKKKLNNLRTSVVNTKKLYNKMKSRMVELSKENKVLYKDQLKRVNNALKYYTKDSIEEIGEVSKSYKDEVPVDYFKIESKYVELSEDEEVEAYNSLYTELVKGDIVLTYSDESGMKYNDTIVAKRKGKGYVIYPLSLVGRIKYVKVTYSIVDEKLEPKG